MARESGRASGSWICHDDARAGDGGSGAAIALMGQIFNMQEHWPAAVMLWAICALAGWWLLGDEFQQTLALLLAAGVAGIGVDVSGKSLSAGSTFIWRG